MTDHIGSVLIPPTPARFDFAPEFRLILSCSWIPTSVLAAAQAATVDTRCRSGIDWSSSVLLTICRMLLNG